MPDKKPSDKQSNKSKKPGAGSKSTGKQGPAQGQEGLKKPSGR